MNKLLLAHVALFLANLIYAANYTIAKVAMPDYVLPLGFIFLRASFGVVFFWTVHRLIVKEKVDKKDFPLLFLCGLFGIALNQMLFFKGLNWTTPINASLILTTVPITVLLISFLVIKERITPRKLIGVIIGGVGAISIILYGQDINLNPDGWKGDILVLLNSTSYGIYLVLVRKLMKKYHPVTVVKWIFLFGWIVVVPFSVREMLLIEWTTFTPVIWWSVLYVLMFVTVGAYFFNAFALQILNPSVVSAYIYSQPILATLIAVLAGRDELNLVKIMGGLLIFVGVFLVSSARKPQLATE